MQKVIAVVQVRMGSTRLPNKALVEIIGRPMLWHIANRLKFAERIDRVVISTSDEPRDDPIREFAERNDIPCFAGSELDLIDRIYRTALKFEAEALVRITGDCPLVEPMIVDKLVFEYLNDFKNIDYVSNTLPPTYPHGLDAEIYPTSTLKRLWDEIENPFYREWFPVYLWDHKDEFRIINITHQKDLSNLRWTVDYEEDLAFVREVYKRLYLDGRIFTMVDLLDLLQTEPSLTALNAKHTKRNEGLDIALNANKQQQGKEKNE